MLFDIENVIYFYMFICIALLLFNVFYILSSNGKKRRLEKKIKRWERVLEETVPVCMEQGKLPEAHRKLLERKLKNINQLIAFNRAMKPGRDRKEIRIYLDLAYAVFGKLAVGYAEKSAMEKAYFAYSVSVYHPKSGKENDKLAEVLLTYLTDSTIYCRQNVLQALCAMGSFGSVESFFGELNAEGLYHNTRLLSDELMNFRGDREALAERLFGRRRGYREDLQVAVVQFATQLSDSFSELFLKELEDESALPEVRFALIRYFQRYPFEKAREFLYSCVWDKNAVDAGLAIPACAALARYPGEKTEETLKEALKSHNWYVRKNAALSVAGLGIEQETLRELKESNDRYASEMLEYIMELKSGREERK